MTQTPGCISCRDLPDVISELQARLYLYRTMEKEQGELARDNARLMEALEGAIVAMDAVKHREAIMDIPLSAARAAVYGKDA